MKQKSFADISIAIEIHIKYNCTFSMKNVKQSYNIGSFIHYDN